MVRTSVLKVLVVYIAVSAVILVSARFFTGGNEFISSIPIFLSVLLLVPIYTWYKNYCKKRELSEEICRRDRSGVLLWIPLLFVLALVVRVPSVLLFGAPYEKTPVIYLLILTILVIDQVDVSVFGFQAEEIGKSLLFGLLFFAILDGVALLILYSMVYLFCGQIPIQSYHMLPFILTMPFMTLCVGISEEGLFRGYMQTYLEKFYSSKHALLFQAVLFGVWHFVWDLHPFDPVHMVFYVLSTFVIGLLFGYFYSKTRKLMPLVFAHGLFDSVPQGIVENQSAWDALRTGPLSNQILVWTLPYIISVVLTLLFVKYLTEEV